MSVYNEAESGHDYKDVYDDVEAAKFLTNRKIMGRRKSVSGEGYDPDEDNGKEENRVVHPKSAEQKQQLLKVMSEIILFSSLDNEQTKFVVDAMFQRKVESGERVIVEGDDGDNFYVIESGNYDVFVNDADTKEPVQKFTYKGTGSFGEIALLYNCPRTATVVAATEGLLWVMDRMTFRRIIVKNAAKKRHKYEKFLKSVKLLSTLTDDERCRVVDAMGTVTHKKGHHILHQGGKADYFYIVMDGFVVIKKVTFKFLMFKKEVELARCRPGDYFGELALITNKPRAASVIVGSDSCTCATLDVEAFERLMGPCKELLRRNIPLYQEQIKKVRKGSKFA